MGFFSILILLLSIYCIYLGIMVLFFYQEIKSTKDKDPAAKNVLEIMMLYPSLQAIIWHRISHALWQAHVPILPRAISQWVRFFTGIEIHPGAQIGRGLFIDHGMGVVIGETAIVGDDVTLFQGVTLGGTGKETGKRHPTLGSNIVVGAGAKILGNIKIGDNSYIGANAVVLRDVPSNSTVVGVPGHITKQDGKKIDLLMDHQHVSDPMMLHMRELLKRIKIIEQKANIDSPANGEFDI